MPPKSPDASFSPAAHRELKLLRIREAKLAQLLEKLSSGPGGYQLTQDDIALISGTSRHEVRQLERRALLKARHRLLHGIKSKAPEKAPQSDF